MNHKTLITLILAAFAAFSCTQTIEPASEKINIIFETDLGNDIDDALATDMLFKYVDAGRVNLLGISINKNGDAPVEFADILRTWYGHPEVPLARVENGASCENDAINYASKVCELTDGDGNPLFYRSGADLTEVPESVFWYRKTLSEMPDGSVTIVSVGFSTNLARLLDSPADSLCALDGRTLIAKKVKRLVTMGGRFDTSMKEYNIVKDIPAAKSVFENWPTEIVTSPFEVGMKIKYPASSIENDFGWADPHPMIEAYKAYQPMPYDRETWDPTALLYAVEGEAYFALSPKGNITVAEGVTTFSEDPKGLRQYLVTDAQQDSLILDRFVELISGNLGKCWVSNYDWANAVRYVAPNRELHITPKAVFIGDSITDGWFRMNAKFFTSNDFAARGTSGQTTTQVLIRTRPDAVELAPEYLVILVGINDIAENEGCAKDIEFAAKNVFSICDIATANGIKPVICTLMPSFHLWREISDIEGKVKAYNALLTDYAKAHGIPVADYYTLFADENGRMPKQYSSDSVHPNIDGYKLMEDLILSILK